MRRVIEFRVFRRSIDGFFWMLGVAVFLYVYFFVPIGRRTLWEHTLRIAATDEARELGDEAEGAAERVKAHVAQEIETRVIGADGGVLAPLGWTP